MGLQSSWNRFKKWTAEKLVGGDYFYTIKGGSNFNQYSTQAEKLDAILGNPAALFIFLLLPELYSMGIYKMRKKKNDGEYEDIEQHPILDLLRKPNPMQTGSQFKWDYMFWRKLGTANLYIDSQVLTSANKLYFFSPDCIEWSQYFEDNAQTVYLSDKAVRDLKNQSLKYKTDNQTLNFKYRKLKQFFDISNGISGWFGSPSRVDALFKIIKNSDNALNSKNINTTFTSKFLVSGRTDIKNTSQLPMGENDKGSIEEAMTSKRSIFPTKTMVDIKRFIEQAGVLEALDKAYMTDAFLIGKMLNIPKDVIEMLSETTYENQEKARAAIIGYCVQPDSEDFCKGLVEYFNIGDDYELYLDYSHLPFVQVYEKEKAESAEMNAEALFKIVSSGGNPQEAADYLGINVTMDGEFKGGSKKDKNDKGDV